MQKAAVLPVPRGYIPTTTIGTLIYTGGGAAIAGGVITDAADSFVYNPVADSINPIASIPRATGETRAMNIIGGRCGSWAGAERHQSIQPGRHLRSGHWHLDIGHPFATARRNFPADTNGTPRLADRRLRPDDVDGLDADLWQLRTPTPTPTATANADTDTDADSYSDTDGNANGDPNGNYRQLRQRPHLRDTDADSYSFGRHHRTPPPIRRRSLGRLQGLARRLPALHRLDPRGTTV